MADGALRREAGQIIKRAKKILRCHLMPRPEKAFGVLRAFRALPPPFGDKIPLVHFPQNGIPPGAQTGNISVPWSL
jgi:hypothetical protein